VQFLDFEEPIADMLAKITELKRLSTHDLVDINAEISKLEKKAQDLTQSIFKKLTPWQIVQLARHPLRPHAIEYLQYIFTDFVELKGDRLYADDHALIAGLAKIDGRSVMVLAQEKGRSTHEKINRNFGMMNPEGYRKAKRLALLAQKFNLPLITFIDTPGAYPGIGAEERGQSEAIATNLKIFSSLRVPIISVIIGEGCSGGALGIGVADRLMMMQYSYFATISPEGCATILFKSAEKASEAAEIMGITAQSLFDKKIVDVIIPEPAGGAHRHPVQAGHYVKAAIQHELNQLLKYSVQELLDLRYEKLLSYGTHGTIRTV
jgi:acetyl-CoA carboxylase carboxyl transferase subunit alpha